MFFFWRKVPLHHFGIYDPKREDKEKRSSYLVTYHIERRQDRAGRKITYLVIHCIGDVGTAL